MFAFDSEFQNMKLVLFIIILFTTSSTTFASEISITMDDPNTFESPLFTPAERNQQILKALDKNKLKSILFVCGKKVDNPEGKALLRSWNQRGHILANHTYSHLSINADLANFASFRDDFLKAEPLIEKYANFRKFFRFPFLKEGNSKERRDEMRSLLASKGYKNGYVTIDASDWYIDDRLRQKLLKDPSTDLLPYRDFYLKHILDRAIYYDDLAKKITGREIKHTLLIHHNLLNALFLNDLIQMFQKQGWKTISAKDAFQDPIFSSYPDIVPAGESIVWALAKESGKYENKLRYPAEDGEYEKKAMDLLGL